MIPLEVHGYISSVFDGDGHFYISKRSTKYVNNKGFVPIIGLTNAQDKMLNYVGGWLDQLGIKYARSSVRCREWKGETKPTQSILVGNILHVKPFLSQFGAEMVTHSNHVHMLRQFLKLREGRFHYGWTEEEIRAVETFKKYPGTLNEHTLSPKFDKPEFLRGWLAGMLDAEGHIGMIICLRSKSKVRMIPTTGYTSCDGRMREVMSTSLQKLSLGHYLDGTEVTIRGLKRARRLLTEIGPYLIGKTKQRDLMMEWIERRLQVTNRTPYDKRDIEIALELKKLNHPSVKMGSELTRERKRHQKWIARLSKELKDRSKK
jgi:hypothetical protein